MHSWSDEQLRRLEKALIREGRQLMALHKKLDAQKKREREKRKLRRLTNQERRRIAKAILLNMSGVGFWRHDD